MRQVAVYYIYKGVNKELLLSYANISRNHGLIDCVKDFFYQHCSEKHIIEGLYLLKV